jgi:small subunit ribosomal protein S20
MPSTKSATKRWRQNVARRLRNRSVRSSVRSQVRKVRTAVAAGNVEQSDTEFKLAVQKLDKAAARRIIHRNAAARTKSRLSRAIKALKTPQQA